MPPTPLSTSLPASPPADTQPLHSAPPSLPLQSYTSSPIDPQARLFYNPAFNSGPAMSESGTVVRWATQGPRATRAEPCCEAALHACPPQIYAHPPSRPRPRCSASHVPRPGYALRMPLSARPSQAAAAASEAAEPPSNPAARRTQSVNRSLDSLDTRARRSAADWVAFCVLQALLHALVRAVIPFDFLGGCHAVGMQSIEQPSPPSLRCNAGRSWTGCVQLWRRWRRTRRRAAWALVAGGAWCMAGNCARWHGTPGKSHSMRTQHQVREDVMQAPRMPRCLATLSTPYHLPSPIPHVSNQGCRPRGAGVSILHPAGPSPAKRAGQRGVG